MMKLISWNVNGVRAVAKKGFADQVKAWNADIICLQETKTVDETFPLQAIKDAGYKHVAMSGMKSYNGVAIRSVRIGI